MDTTNQTSKEEVKYNVTHRYLISYDDETDLSDVSLVDKYDDDEFDYRVNEDSSNNYLTMEQINQKFKFLKDSIDMGNVIKGDKVTLVYPFEGDPNLIEKVKPSCGCTADVKIDKVNNQITAVYNSINENPGGMKKSILVYFKDNKQLQIKNSLGVNIMNPGKAKVALTLKGTIVKKK
jgi:hypothetical protein